MTANLSIELLRSFVAVVEKGSIVKATERIFLSQSALSLQLKRLEEIVQRPLFERDGTRRLTITAAGTELLGHAREILAANDRALTALAGGNNDAPIRLGIVQDFAENILPLILADFTSRYPDTRLTIRMDTSSELVRAYRDNQLDIVLCLSLQADAHALARKPVRWIGRPDLAAQEILPLVLLPEPFAYRTLALQALERAGRRYRIVAESPSVDGLRAALQGGLGITARTLDFLAPAQAAEMLPDGLPPLPDISYVLHHSEGKAGALADLIRPAFAGQVTEKKNNRRRA